MKVRDWSLRKLIPKYYPELQNVKIRQYNWEELTDENIKQQTQGRYTVCKPPQRKKEQHYLIIDGIGIGHLLQQSGLRIKTRANIHLGLLAHELEHIIDMEQGITSWEEPEDEKNLDRRAIKRGLIYQIASATDLLQKLYKGQPGAVHGLGTEDLDKEFGILPPLHGTNGINRRDARNGTRKNIP